tara:strand:+ start:113 stop:643 length:531 start_codon:yes stop_codon:yes gene_type:complete
MVGIYTITNKLDGKMYVGSSNNVNKRITAHKSELKNNKHVNAKLQNAVNKYDLSNFEFKLLDECELDHQFAIECYWYNLLNPSYNLVDVNPNGGRSWSSEQRAAHTSVIKNRIRLTCTPLFATDPRECYLFESISQAVRVLFDDECYSVYYKGISNAIKGPYSRFNGWEFKQIDND